MRILFVVPYQFVPPDSGNKNLLYNLLKYVTKEAACDLALLVDDLSEMATIEATLRKEYPAVGVIAVFRKPRGLSLLRARLGMLAHVYHPSLGRYANSSLATWLASQVASGSYDLIHFDMVHTAPYRAFCDKTPTLLVASDAYSMAAKNTGALSPATKDRFRLQVESWLLRNFERREYPHFTIVCTVSERDGEYLKGIAPTATIQTIGIGVAPEYAERTILHFKNATQNSRKILCTGSLNHHLVADDVINFLRQSLPSIKTLFPDVEVTILGQNPMPELKQYVQKTAGIEHIDYVRDYADFLDQDWVYVYPQRTTTGLQTKIQQAMALGLPVVAYDGSFGGLSAESGKHCYSCKDGNDVTTYVLKLIGDAGLRREMGSSAAVHVRENFSIQEMGRQMISIYQEAIAT